MDINQLRLTIAYIQIMYLHAKGMFNNHTAYNLYRIHVTATIAMGEVINMGNIVPRTGFEPTPLTFQTTVLTIAPPNLI